MLKQQHTLIVTNWLFGPEPHTHVSSEAMKQRPQEPEINQPTTISTGEMNAHRQEP